MYEEFSGINWDTLTSIGTLLMAITNVILVAVIYLQTQIMSKTLRVNTLQIATAVKSELDKLLVNHLYRNGLFKLLDIPTCDPKAWSNINQISKYKIYITNMTKSILILEFLINLFRQIPDSPTELVEKLEEEVSKFEDYRQKLLQEILQLEHQYNSTSCKNAHHYRTELLKIARRIDELLIKIEKQEPLLAPTKILQTQQ